uniref:Putative secreted protein n=1 Tax=Ixodes ricinus TaxID=34613 RepID=A0A6B0URA5_IXORI
MSSAASRALSWFRHARITLAFLLANSLAVSLPIPVLEPVMMTVFPDMSTDDLHFPTVSSAYNLTRSMTSTTSDTRPRITHSGTRRPARDDSRVVGAVLRALTSCSTSAICPREYKLPIRQTGAPHVVSIFL